MAVPSLFFVVKGGTRFLLFRGEGRNPVPSLSWRRKAPGSFSFVVKEGTRFLLFRGEGRHPVLTRRARPLFPQALLGEFAAELAAKTASLDTDPHLWMPLTVM